MPSERDHRDKGAAIPEGGAPDFAVRTRKRKADVVIFLQDPDEDVAGIEMTKKKQNESQEMSDSSKKKCILQRPPSILPRTLMPTPSKEERGSPKFSSIHQSLTAARDSPLPVLGWANRDEVWKNMIRKEQAYARDKLYMQRHPLLQPKMRVILLDWLMEVCEVYKLHRETFYLAQDFFDRYMAIHQNVVKTLLQLIGISSLFIAAKHEEIYPPKLRQFAYVTDGACTEEEILDMELLIMKALDWHLSPLTVVSWLKVYLQIAYLNEIYEMLLPHYPQQIFVQIAELLDLCVLDIGCLEYPYGVLAASALYHFSSCELMQRVSGYEFSDIEVCVKWMVPFAMVIKEAGSATVKRFRGVPAEDLHNIQTHINTFDLLDQVQAKQASLAGKGGRSPLLPPLQSSERPPPPPPPPLL